jgi:hypothetical protein
MQRSRSIIRAAAWSAAILIAAARPAISDCTTNFAQVCLQKFVSADSIAYFHRDCSPLEGSYGVVSWELGRGQVDLFAQHACGNPCEAIGPGIAIVRVTDVFSVLGPPSTSPLAFDAVLEISINRPVGFQSCAPIQVSFGKTGEPDSLVYQDASCFYGSQFLVLHLVHLPGEPFELFEHGSITTPLTTSNNRGAALVLSFRGLPAEATVTSCHGYISDRATPTVEKSWGRVKLIYR